MLCYSEFGMVKPILHSGDKVHLHLVYNSDCVLLHLICNLCGGLFVFMKENAYNF